MKKLTRILAIILSIMLLLTAAGCSSDNKEGNTNKSQSSQNENKNETQSTNETGTPGKQKIGIIQYIEHVALDAAREGFIAALEDNGYKDGQNIEIDYQNAQGDQSNLSTISDRFVSNKVDLILAIATPAAQAVAGKTKEIPILGTAITDYVAAKLVNSNEAPGGNVSGTTDMNPIKEQIDLLIKLVPNAKTVGVLYTSSEDNSVVQAKIAREIIEKLGTCYVAKDSTGNGIVLNYRIELPNDSKSKLLKSNNMPIYYATYKLTNDKLENIEFGFEYP